MSYNKIIDALENFSQVKKARYLLVTSFNPGMNKNIQIGDSSSVTRFNEISPFYQLLEGLFSLWTIFSANFDMQLGKFSLLYLNGHFV